MTSAGCLALVLWPLFVVPVAFALWLLLLAATMSRKPSGHLADKDVRIRIIKPAFSNAEIALEPIHKEDPDADD